MSGQLGAVITNLSELSQLFGGEFGHPQLPETISAADLERGTILAREASTGKFKQLLPETAVTGENIGTGDGVTKTFTNTEDWTGIVVAHYPVIPRTVTIVAGAVSGADDGYGHIIGAGIDSGIVRYDTGEITITFSVAPANALAITADYSYGSTEDLHIPRGILAEDAAAAAIDVSAMVCMAGIYRDSAVIWPTGITAANKTRAKLALADRGIYLI